MGTADSLEKSLMLGKTEGRRKREHQRTSWLDGITNAMDMNLHKLCAGEYSKGVSHLFWSKERAISWKVKDR